ncbi:MAG: Stk1 family PASTA domain-containing Ser/Thr kinase, partial [Eubacteriales bacterium]|nr:Stk1 family PASTA domain-containing Ser/Thr kinase [Eubacteriales bacterium]
MIGKIIAGKYRVLDLKGTGGMAQVFRAQDMENGRIVAIKVLKPEHMQDEEIVHRFMMETQIASTYSHRNIVKTYETGCEAGMHYIVMEFIDGDTLQEYIHAKGRLDVEETLRIGQQICAALFYAHSHRLIHRDIKPQNILLTEDGVAKVADFGIAKAPTMDTATVGDSALGSVHYISPEQARGNPVDEKTDIYSMGVVLYEMSTGQVPFSGDTPVSVALKQVQEEPRPPRQLRPEIPKALERIILKAMMKNPAARYDNAREMARDLEKVLLYPEGSYVVIKNNFDETGTRVIPTIKVDDSAPTNTTQPPYRTGRLTGPTGTSGSYPRKTERKRTPAHHKLMLAICIVAGLLVLSMSGYLVVRSLVGVPAKAYNTEVPKVVELPQSVAESQLQAAGLICVVNKVYDETYPADTVIAQTPEGGTKVPSGSKVQLSVSLGSMTVETPQVLDQTLSVATTL